MTGGRSRYETIVKLAAGGMATVYVGTVRGALGFRQLVAIKKPHAHLLEDPAFRTELVAEARLASMIHHTNVVDVRDVEIDGSSISLVMDYIEGASLGELLVAASARQQRLPPRAAVRIALDALAGLQAAHDLVDERGRPVRLVHRDVSPQNILVGTDGTSRVVDFGVAKFARKNMQSTTEGTLKGKLGYMAPEYVRGEAIDRRLDVFAMGVVLWEALAGQRCFRAPSEGETLHRLLHFDPEPISRVHAEVGTALDEVLACALAKSRDERFQNAAAMASALEASAAGAGLLGSQSDVARALRDLVGDTIEERRRLVRARFQSEPSIASITGVSPEVEQRVAEAHAAHVALQAPAAGAPAPAAAGFHQERTLAAPMPSTEPGPFGGTLPADPRAVTASVSVQVEMPPPEVRSTRGVARDTLTSGPAEPPTESALPATMVSTTVSLRGIPKRTPWLWAGALAIVVVGVGIAGGTLALRHTLARPEPTPSATPSADLGTSSAAAVAAAPPALTAPDTPATAPPSATPRPTDKAAARAGAATRAAPPVTARPPPAATTPQPTAATTTRAPPPNPYPQKPQ